MNNRLLKLLKHALSGAEYRAIISHITENDIPNYAKLKYQILIDGIAIEKLLYNVIVIDDDGDYAINPKAFGYPNLGSENGERYTVNLETGQTGWIGPNDAQGEIGYFPAYIFRALDDVDFTRIELVRLEGNRRHEMALSDMQLEGCASDYLRIPQFRDTNILSQDNHVSNIIDIMNNVTNLFDHHNIEEDANLYLALTIVPILFIMSISPSVANIFIEIAEDESREITLYPNISMKTLLEKNIPAHPDEFNCEDYRQLFDQLFFLSMEFTAAWNRLALKSGLFDSDSIPVMLTDSINATPLSEILECLAGITKFYWGKYPAELKFNVLGVYGNCCDDLHIWSGWVSRQSRFYVPVPTNVEVLEQTGLSSGKDSFYHQQIILPNGTKSIKRRTDIKATTALTNITIISDTGVEERSLTPEDCKKLLGAYAKQSLVPLEYVEPSINADGDLEIYTYYPIATNAHLKDIKIKGKYASTNNLYSSLAAHIKLENATQYNDIHEPNSNENPHFFLSALTTMLRGSTTQYLIQIDKPNYLSSEIENGSFWDHRGHVKNINLSSRMLVHPALMGFMLNIPLPTHSITILPLKVTMVGGQDKYLVITNIKKLVPTSSRLDQAVETANINYTTYYAFWDTAHAETMNVTLRNSNNYYFKRKDDTYGKYYMDHINSGSYTDEEKFLFEVPSTSITEFMSYVTSHNTRALANFLISNCTNVTSDFADYFSSFVKSALTGEYTLSISNSALNFGTISDVIIYDAQSAFCNGFYSVSGFTTFNYLELRNGLEILAQPLVSTSDVRTNMRNLCRCIYGEDKLTYYLPLCDIIMTQDTTASEVDKTVNLTTGFGNRQVSDTYGFNTLNYPHLETGRLNAKHIDGNAAEILCCPSGVEKDEEQLEPFFYESLNDGEKPDGNARWQYVYSSAMMRCYVESAAPFPDMDGVVFNMMRFNETNLDSEENCPYHLRSNIEFRVGCQLVDSVQLACTSDDPVTLDRNANVSNYAIGRGSNISYNICSILKTLYWVAVDAHASVEKLVCYNGAWEDKLDEDVVPYLYYIKDITVVEVSTSTSDDSKGYKIANIELYPHFYNYSDISTLDHFKQLSNYETAYMRYRWFSTSGATLEPDDVTTREESDPETVWIKNINGWQDVYIYAFRRLSSSEVVELAPWPGVRCEPVAQASDATGVWYRLWLEDFYGAWDYIVISNNGSNQTGDLNLGDPTYYVSEPVNSEKQAPLYTYIKSSGLANVALSNFRVFADQRQRAALSSFKSVNAMDAVLDKAVDDLSDAIVAPSLYQTKAILDAQNFKVSNTILQSLAQMIENGTDKIKALGERAVDAVASFMIPFSKLSYRVLPIGALFSLDQLHALQRFIVDSSYYHMFNILDVDNIIDGVTGFSNNMHSVLSMSQEFIPFRTDIYSEDGELSAGFIVDLKSFMQKIVHYYGNDVEVTPSRDIRLILETEFQKVLLKEDDSVDLHQLPSIESILRFRTLTDEQRVMLKATLSDLFSAPRAFASQLMNVGANHIIGYISKFKSALSLFRTDSVTLNFLHSIGNSYLPNAEEIRLSIPLPNAILQEILNLGGNWSTIMHECEDLHPQGKDSDLTTVPDVITSFGFIRVTIAECENLSQLLPSFKSIYEAFANDDLVYGVTDDEFDNLREKLVEILSQYGSYFTQETDNDEVVKYDDLELIEYLNVLYTLPSTIMESLLSCFTLIKDEVQLTNVSIKSISEYQNYVNNFLTSHNDQEINSLIKIYPVEFVAKLLSLFGYAVMRYDDIINNIKDASVVALTGYYASIIEDVTNDEESILAQIFSQLGGESIDATSENDSIASKISSVVTPLANQLLGNITTLASGFPDNSHFTDIFASVKQNISTYVTNLISHLQSNNIISGLSGAMSSFLSNLDGMKNNALAAVSSALQRIPNLTSYFKRSGFSIYDNDKLSFDGYQSLDNVYKALGMTGWGICGALGLIGYAINSVLTKTYQLARDFLISTVYDGASITYRRSGFEAIDITCYTKVLSYSDFSDRFPNIAGKMDDYYSKYPAELTFSVLYVNMFIFFTLAADKSQVTIAMTPKLYDAYLSERNDAVIYKSIYDSYMQNIKWLNHINSIAMAEFSNELGDFTVYGFDCGLSYEEARAATAAMTTFNTYLPTSSLDQIYEQAIKAPYRQSDQTTDTFIAWSLAVAGAGGMIAMTGNVVPGAIIGAIGLSLAGAAYLCNDYSQRQVETNDASKIMSTALNDKTYGNAMILNSHLYDLIKSYPLSACDCLMEHLFYYDDLGLIHSGDGELTEHGLHVPMGFTKGQPKLALHLRSDFEIELLKAAKYGIAIATGVGSVVMASSLTRSQRIAHSLDKTNAQAYALDTHDPKYLSKQTALQRKSRKKSAKLDSMHSDVIDVTYKVVEKNQSAILEQFSLPQLVAGVCNALGYSTAASVIANADRTEASRQRIDDIADSVASDNQNSIPSTIGAMGATLAGVSAVALFKKFFKKRLGRDISDDELLDVLPLLFKDGSSL